MHHLVRVRTRTYGHIPALRFDSEARAEGSQRDAGHVQYRYEVEMERLSDENQHVKHFVPPDNPRPQHGPSGGKHNRPDAEGQCPSDERAQSSPRSAPSRHEAARAARPPQDEVNHGDLPSSQRLHHELDRDGRQREAPGKRHELVGPLCFERGINGGPRPGNEEKDCTVINLSVEIEPFGGPLHVMKERTR